MMRALYLSLLTNAPSTIVNPAWSSEAVKLSGAVKLFGLRTLDERPDRVVVEGVGRSLHDTGSAVPVAGSAFNFRTLSALASLSPHWTVLESDASMLARPVLEHLTFLKDLGAELEDVSDSGSLRVRIRGGHQVGGDVTVDTRHSSQLLTAVLMIAPLADMPVTVRSDGEGVVGEGYIDLTVAMMREQGAVVAQDGDVFSVDRGAYQSRLHHVTSDFTALSYLAGVIATVPGSAFTITDYYPSTLSSEIEFLTVLRRLGIQAEHDPVERELRLSPGEPEGPVIEIDGRNIPTVVPTLAAIAPFVDATVTVRGAAHVNNHKCRRVEVMVAGLRELGCRIDPVLDADGVVEGFTSPAGGPRPAGGGRLSGHGDHRIVMSLATAALGAERPTAVEGAEHLGASFPDYLDAMTRLGAEVDLNPIE